MKDFAELEFNRNLINGILQAQPYRCVSVNLDTIHGQLLDDADIDRLLYDFKLAVDGYKIDRANNVIHLRWKSNITIDEEKMIREVIGPRGRKKYK